MNRYLLLASTLVVLAIEACKSNHETAEETVVQPKTPIDSLTALIEKNPENAVYLAERASMYLDERKFKEALEDIDKAWLLDSNHIRVQLIRGDVYYVLNRTRASRDSWLKCVEQDPNNEVCRMRLAELYLAVKDLEAAMEHLKVVLEKNKTNANAHFMMGVVIRDLYGDTDRALLSIQRAIEIKEDYVDALDMMGVLLTAKGDPLAIKYLQNALDYSPNRHDLIYKLGYAYMRFGKFNEAMDMFTKATMINPKDEDSYFNMGFIHVETKNYSIAREYFDKAVKANPESFKAYYGRGYTNEMLGNAKAAIEDYTHALTLNPEYTPAAESLKRFGRY
ncbi:MAG: tetratricopeptide repeat protein [Thermaurantimonas sp.]|uniref:tetratricopeptide repeat protein n=1 Tax=Thermaurantimonas sp. TaxID=2681568 RepID=UPI00391CCC8B